MSGLLPLEDALARVLGAARPVGDVDHQQGELDPNDREQIVQATQRELRPPEVQQQDSDLAAGPARNTTSAGTPAARTTWSFRTAGCVGSVLSTNTE